MESNRMQPREMWTQSLVRLIVESEPLSLLILRDERALTLDNLHNENHVTLPANTKLTKKPTVGIRGLRKIESQSGAYAGSVVTVNCLLANWSTYSSARSLCVTSKRDTPLLCASHIRNVESFLLRCVSSMI